MHQAWHGHLWAFGLVRQYYVGEHHGDDMDLITLWVVVIPYINSVGLLCFPPLGSTPGWLLIWILLSTGGAFASDIHVTNSAA